MDKFAIFAILLLVAAIIWFNRSGNNHQMFGGAIDTSWFLGQNIEDPDLYPIMPQTTRNMSYDIRGDPYIPLIPVSPWNNPEAVPIRW